MRTLICALLCSLPSIPAAHAGQTAKSLRVLFLGNSYTYYNEMPTLFRNLAKAAQPDLALEVRAITEGGISLGELWHKRDVQDALDRERWDYVVLQEHSMLGWTYRDGEEVISDPAYFWQSLQLYGPKIRRAGAIPVLFHTWSRKSKLDAQPELDYAYTTAAREIKAKLAPVGHAWLTIRQQNPEIELYAADSTHPTLAGSYLAACVFLQTIVESKCEASPAPAGLNAEQVDLLQSAADAAVLDWRKLPVLAAPKPRPAPPEPNGTGGNAMPATLQGVWKGRTSLYRQQTNIEVDLKVDGDQCQVAFTAVAEQGAYRSTRPAQSCVVEPGGLSFVLHDWFSSAVETHHVRFQGKDLVGRVYVGFRSVARAASGTWRARPIR